jgi:hypothetical protein
MTNFPLIPMPRVYADTETIDSLRRMLAAANELLGVRDLQLTALRQALHEATTERDALAHASALVLTDATDPGPALVAETAATIRATEFSFSDDCWKYALSDGTIAKGNPGDARMPCGMPFSERSQWGANQVARTDDGSDAHEPQAMMARLGGIMDRALRDSVTILPTDSDDPQSPAPETAIDTVVDALGKRLVGAPDRQRLGRALDVANAPDATDDRREQDAAVNRAFTGRVLP